MDQHWWLGYRREVDRRLEALAKAMRSWPTFRDEVLSLTWPDVPEAN